MLQKAMGACCAAVQIYRRYRLPSSVTASRASGKDIFKARYIIRMDTIMKSELHNTRRPRDAIELVRRHYMPPPLISSDSMKRDRGWSS